jgi:hypothetical protein
MVLILLATNARAFETHEFVATKYLVYLKIE